MTFTESLISSALLMTMAAHASQLFGDSIHAIGKSRLRDGINTSIQKDIEEIRDIVSLWSINTMSTDGQLSYAPPQADCENSILAKTLLSEHSSQLPGSKILDLSNISTPSQELEVTRTIGTVSDNENLILINYSAAVNSKVKTQASATLSIPAQGWCK